jgi:xylose isomerase
MFDTKLRRQSMDLEDLFHGHIGAMDTLALSLERAVKMIESESLSKLVDQRYAKWNEPLGADILAGKHSLQDLAAYAEKNNIDPKPVSGRQEMLENVVNGFIYK